MLRPATPLTVLLFCAFVLLLISVLSTPVVKGIPLARYGDTSYGVFGYCSDSKGCSRIKIGWNADELFSSSSSDGDFNLPSSARHSLSSLLIVHPIAAFFCLVMTALAAAAHFHSPSHSPRYLLALLILTLPTLLITLLAFLVDILLFIPHLTWGGWIVLAPVILIVASGIMLCAMRRTLVSRKARKKRIAENAEMSGENFYSRQEREDIKMTTAPTMSSESKIPLVSGAIGTDTRSQHVPFSTGPPSEGREMYGNSQTAVSPISEVNRYFSSPSRSSSRPRPEEVPPMPINQYGPPPMDGQQLPLQENRATNYPPNAYGRGRGYGPPRGRGGPPGGRGGFGPPPRGGYRGPPGPPGQYPSGRGGFGPDMRGNHSSNGRGGGQMGPMMVAGAGGAMMAGSANHRPPPEYPQSQHGSATGSTPYSQGAMNYEPVSPSDYGSPQIPDAYGESQRQPNASRGIPPQDRRPYSEDDLPRAESPPPELGPIGNAVEMDATTGQASGYVPIIHDIVTLPQGHGSSGPRMGQEQAGYHPPRNNWSNNPQDNVSRGPTSNRARGSSVVSDNSRYYEDVDPRFAEPQPLPPVPAQHARSRSGTLHPPNNNNNNNHSTPSPESLDILPHTHSFENIPAGARSPAISEQSGFTSVSQRPVNPNWRPGHGGEFNQFGPPPAQRNDRSQVRQDMLLANNPDFELPGMGPQYSRGMRPSGRGGMRAPPVGMGGVQRAPLPPSALSLGGDGRYPEPVVPSGIGSVRDV